MGTHLPSHCARSIMFLTSSLFLAAAFGLQSQSLLVTSAPTDSGDVVDTGYAQYQGNRSFENTVAYLGVPDAEPPLGDLRFRAPLPLNTSRVAEEAGGQVVYASQNPDFCIQGTIGRTFHVFFFRILTLITGFLRGRRGRCWVRRLPQCKCVCTIRCEERR